MKESLKTVVMIDSSDGEGYEEAELDITFEDDVLDFIIEGKSIFSGDWSGNFEPIFMRALELWQTSRGDRQ